jgi:hypothetical protein
MDERKRGWRKEEEWREGGREGGIGVKRYCHHLEYSIV